MGLQYLQVRTPEKICERVCGWRTESLTSLSTGKRVDHSSARCSGFEGVFGAGAAQPVRWRGGQPLVQRAPLPGKVHYCCVWHRVPLHSGCQFRTLTLQELLTMLKRSAGNSRFLSHVRRENCKKPNTFMGKLMFCYHLELFFINFHTSSQNHSSRSGVDI